LFVLHVAGFIARLRAGMHESIVISTENPQLSQDTGTQAFTLWTKRQFFSA
jgi:hypothetical protein